jgi:quinol monooxygenase YgiN
MADAVAKTRLSQIVELRQYDLHPGTRETLIDVFDSHLVEGQEAEEMVIIGQFRDLDNPDSFVWLRGFADMEARKRALTGFYSGPVWLANRDAANATMLRFDNVLLLTPAGVDGGFALDIADRPPPGSATPESGLIAATIWSLRGDAAAFAEWHRETLEPVIANAGGEIIASFITERAENTYPALPVRTDETVLVTFSAFADAAALDRHRAALAASPRWNAAMKEAAGLVAPPRTLRLAPTARSLLR